MFTLFEVLLLYIHSCTHRTHHHLSLSVRLSYSTSPLRRTFSSCPFETCPSTILLGFPHRPQSPCPMFRDFTSRYRPLSLIDHEPFRPRSSPTQHPDENILCLLVTLPLIGPKDFARQSLGNVSLFKSDSGDLSVIPSAPPSTPPYLSHP